MAKLLLLLIGGFALQWDTAFTRKSSNPNRNYPSYPTGSYPSYPTGNYPSYPTGNYPSYPTGRYPNYPTGNYPSYPTGGYPSYPTGNYPSYPTGGYPSYPTGMPDRNRTTCASNPCQNGGKCVSSRYSSWYCKCNYPYSGTTCQYTYTDPCKKSENPCQNEGVCNTRKTNYWGSKKYELACICPKSHIGPKCQYENPCAENPCVNGKCFPSHNGTKGTFRCQCNGGFEGKTCNMPTPVLCVADKCKNNGICYQTFNYSTQMSEAKCFCNGNWGGKDCSEDISNPCQSDPCGNNGACTNGPNGKFFCTCSNGFMGKNCEVANPCSEDTCGKHGKCLRHEQYINGTMELRSVCACDSQHAGLKCEFLNPCLESNPCLNSGKCYSYAKRTFYYSNRFSHMSNVNTTGFSEVKCSCPMIFGGINCEILSPCASDNPCQNSGVCVDKTSYSRVNGTYVKVFKTPYCVCPHDFTGKNCETKIINPCEEDPCQNEGICIAKGNVKDAFECNCLGGYVGKTCEEKDPKITSCNFENKLCPGFTTTKTGKYAWLINSGSTRSYNTGPSKAKEGRYYIYTEASSPAKPGDTAYIRSNFFTTESESCVSMDYHMYGRDIGSLTVKVEDSDGEMTSNEEISIAGNKGNNWFSLELNVKPGTSRISILGVRGENWAGDIAIDNIVWNGKPCKDDGEGGEGGEKPDTGEPDN